ncbi:MAG: YlbF family regulator [Clostridia bacterium]|nr:YlbF family regulator [Clostridia bacterium]MBR3875555.1 YlbF family regulator [Clostridia bacterium]
MTRIMELAHMLGEEIAKSDEIKNLEATKEVFQSDAALQNKMSEYEAERMLLGQEFAKNPDEADARAIADLRARIEELSSEIGSDPKYIAFAEAQRAMNALMADVNAEIKYCITGERPSDCTHDCSTCKGCH